MIENRNQTTDTPEVPQNVMEGAAGGEADARKYVEQLIAESLMYQSWIKEMKDYDVELAKHSQDIAMMAVAIARKMGLPNVQVDILAKAGLAHDRGKVKIPHFDEHASQQLTREEKQKIFGAHPRESKLMIEAEDPVVAEIIETHHLFQDNFYPEDMPEPTPADRYYEEKRILAVCDAVDAIRSGDRKYKKAFTQEETLREMLKDTRKQKHMSPELITTVLDTWSGLFPDEV